MTRKITVLAIFLLALGTRSVAQELGIELNGGLQGSQYSLQNGQTKLLPGGSLGLNYSFRLARNWNLLTGVTGGLYRTQATLRDGLVFTYDQVDDAGSAFEYNVKATGYKETQQFFAAGIPLLFQYHTAGAGAQWYLNAGGRIFLPLSASIRQSAQQLSLSGYYPDYNIEVSNIPQHGFGTIDNWKASQTANLKPSGALSAATGASFRLSRTTRLYAGIYIDYGLSDMKGKTDSMPFATYSPTGVSHVQANSVLKMPATGQMTLLSYGLQLRLSFGSAKARTTARPKPKPVTRDSTAYLFNERDTLFIQKPVIFGVFGETAIPDIEKDHLDEVASLLRLFPRIRISITGHVCNSSTETEDPQVGENRAKAVADYLRNQGIDRNRMDIDFIHQSDPMLPNNPSKNAQNRRADIKVE